MESKILEMNLQHSSLMVIQSNNTVDIDIEFFLVDSKSQRFHTLVGFKDRGHDELKKKICVAFWSLS